MQASQSRNEELCETEIGLFHCDSEEKVSGWQVLVHVEVKFIK